jgi:hypothetical protein
LTARPTRHQGSFKNSHNGGGCMLRTELGVYLGTPQMLSFNNSCLYALAYTSLHDSWNPFPLFIDTRFFGNTAIMTFRMVRRDSRN